MDVAPPAPPRLIVGITGASGSIFGVRLLERLASRVSKRT